MLRRGTRIHERLSNDRQARIHRSCFVDVKYKVRILDKIYPKPQWKTEKQSTFYLHVFTSRLCLPDTGYKIVQYPQTTLNTGWVTTV